MKRNLAEGRLVRMTGRLIRQLDVREQLLVQRQKHYDLITAILQASSPKRSKFPFNRNWNGTAPEVNRKANGEPIATANWQCYLCRLKRKLLRKWLQSERKWNASCWLNRFRPELDLLPVSFWFYSRNSELWLKETVAGSSKFLTFSLIAIDRLHFTRSCREMGWNERQKFEVEISTVPMNNSIWKLSFQNFEYRFKNFHNPNLHI